MLTTENNKILTETSAGTPMGDLLRRYWYPIAAVGELEEKPTKRVRLLGEDLVLYKDLGGRYGLVDRHCPHRRADMSFGYRRGMRAALQLSRLALRRGRQMHRAALRRHGRSEVGLQGQDANQGLSGRGQGRPALGVSGPAAGAAGAGLGAVQLEERLRADRVLDHPLQLVPVPGELDRSRAFRMDARQLVDAAQGQARPLRRQAPEGRVRRIRIRLSSIAASARTPTRTTRCGRSAASACGRTASSPAAISNGACRSMTRTTLSVGWFFNRVPKDREPYVQNSIPHLVRAGDRREEATGSPAT